jgi:transmembrane sensor
MPEQERIRYLLDKYIEDAATPGELEELKLLLNQASYEQAAKDHLLNLLRDTMPMAVHSDERLQAVLRGMREERQVTIRRHWWAAAAVLLGAAIALWMVTRKTIPPPTVADRQSLQHDRAPGGNVAVLTLADGRTIPLDSAHNGLLAEQGNSSVSKSADGALAYRPLKGARTPAVYNKLSTPRGGQYRLLLPDGSQVWLNAASSISYPTAFTDSVRSVTITGEAYFEIAPNAAMPFLVRVDAAQGQKEVRVLGTHFNVKAYNDENAVTTTLLEGSVQLVDAGEGKTFNAGPILKPGEQAQWRADGSVHLDAHADIDEAVAWKNGLFHFEHADLPAIMRQLARWYDVDVVFRGRIPAARFDGEIPRSSNLTEVFKILQLSNVRFTVEDKKVIVEQ